MLATACSTLLCAAHAHAGNTPAQDLAEQQWQACRHFATIRLVRIQPDGRIVATGSEYETRPFVECLRAVAARQNVGLATDPSSVVQIEGTPSASQPR